jgi:hypothetical protein
MNKKIPESDTLGRKSNRVRAKWNHDGKGGHSGPENFL